MTTRNMRGTDDLGFGVRLRQQGGLYRSVYKLIYLQRTTPDGAETSPVLSIFPAH